MNNFEKGWVIGFLEGEGCFTSHKNNGYKHIRILAASTDLDALEKLQTIAGGNLNGPYGMSKHNNLKVKNPKPYYQWSLHKQKEVTKLLEVIKPHLSSRRQQRIEEIIGSADEIEEQIDE